MNYFMWYSVPRRYFSQLEWWTHHKTVMLTKIFSSVFTASKIIKGFMMFVVVVVVATLSIWGRDKKWVFSSSEWSVFFLLLTLEKVVIFGCTCTIKGIWAKVLNLFLKLSKMSLKVKILGPVGQIKFRFKFPLHQKMSFKRILRWPFC